MVFFSLKVVRPRLKAFGRSVMAGTDGFDSDF
jgi:hypothetical protein